MYRRFVKRVIDCFLSVVGLIICFLPMLIIAVAIKLSSKGPVIFKQERLGKHEKHFTVYKFRSMVDDAYANGGLATRSDDPRITKVGAFLRRTSLDELPQMVNIIKGDMAIIGPRPILPWEFDGYRDNPIYRKRHDVLPGLFCSVDIELRASADRDVQFQMDAEYADNVRFTNDVKLFFGVLKTVLTGKNVYREEVSQKEEQ